MFIVFCYMEIHLCDGSYHPMKNPNTTINIFDYNGEEDRSPSPQPKNVYSQEVVHTEDIIGKGGMGIVYKGLQQYPKRTVAIKKLRVRNPRTEYALFTEAMITGQLSHPNIVPIHLLNPHGDDGPEVVMSCIQGHTLLSLLDNNSISLKKSLFVLDQICNALHYAHSKKVLHRDIKPENIMIGNYGEVYLLDWGVAFDQKDSQTKPRQILGTPSYMAPEMCSPQTSIIDERSDVYLCGATLHHILTKSPRHVASTTEATLALAQQSAPFEYSSEIFGDLANLANKACHLNPQERPQSIPGFQQELQQSLLSWETLTLIHSGYEALEALKKSSSGAATFLLFIDSCLLK